MNRHDKITQLKATMADAQRQIDGLEELKEWPQEGDKFWFIHSAGTPVSTSWTRQPYSKGRKAQGNVFHTKEEAQHESDRRALIVELDAFTDFKPQWTDGKAKHFIEFRHEQEIFSISARVCDQVYGQVYFKSRAEATLAIDHFGDRLKILFN